MMRKSFLLSDDLYKTKIFLSDKGSGKAVKAFY